MLGGTLTSALFRSGTAAGSLAAAALTAALVVATASVWHRRIRSKPVAQLAATSLLSLAAVPVELAGGVPGPSVASAAMARTVVFFSGALVVRAAFARSSRRGADRTQLLHFLSVAIASTAALGFYVSGLTKESLACSMAAGLCACLAYRRPTVKDLKPLGLMLSGLVFASTMALTL